MAVLTIHSGCEIHDANMSILTDDLCPADSATIPDNRVENCVRHTPLAASAVAVLQILLVLSVWLLTRAYQGIRHDSRIYIGRALADLDPNGVGRDALFAFDGQTHLTIYSFFTVPLVRFLGASTSAIVITYATLLIWLASAAWLASQMMPRRLIPAALICAAALPAVYGPFSIFSFAEPFASPRGLAEAGVLLALAGWLSGRRFLACVALVFALALHIPTALAGAGVLFIVLAVDTPIVWLIALMFGAVAAAAGLLHFGPAKILFQSYDPQWLAINRERNRFLFVSLWPAAAWSHAVVSGVTLFIAAASTQGHLRRVLLATLVVAAAGVSASYFLGELPSNILLLQLQPWRTLWLVKLLALMMSPFCASVLWSAGRKDSYLVLALLACAWYVIDYSWFALPLSVITLALFMYDRYSAGDHTSRRTLWLAVSACLSLGLIDTSCNIFVEANLLRAAHIAGAPLSAQAFAPLLPELGFFAAAAAVVLSLKPWPRTATWRAAALAVSVVILLPLAVLLADRRDATQRMSDVGAGRDTIESLLGPTPNGVVWVSGQTQPLFWAGRPSWTNSLQGTAGAFSRRLAVQWDRRSRMLVADGMAFENERNPYLPPNATDLDPAVVARGAVNICRSPDGPDAIVAPYDLTKNFPSGRVRLWHTPIHNLFDTKVRPWGVSYVERDRYSILRCADIR
jgi:hypothetical protein